MLLMLYLVAITAEAMTGALSAGRRGMDWFGVVLIACVTALGGGSVRDLSLIHILAAFWWTSCCSSSSGICRYRLVRYCQRKL